MENLPLGISDPADLITFPCSQSRPELKVAGTERESTDPGGGRPELPFPPVSTVSAIFEGQPCIDSCIWGERGCKWV